MLVSCKKDDVNPELPIDQEQPENIITTPCDFDLSDVKTNSIISVNCLLDLKGETYTLPKGVSFDFEGGDIVNGKLIFSGGTIDGRLLSSKIEVEGDVQLKSTTFKFFAIRWDIVEGETTSAIALENNTRLEKLMFRVKELGATTFKINKLDAYFEVTKVTSTSTNANWYPSLESVNIPSDFTLEMTDNTHLRLFPANLHNRKGGAILAIRDASDITVKGGNLHGDRDERVFSVDDNGTEGSHLFMIHSGRNITVDGVNFEEGSAGTFAIQSFGFSFNDDYNPTENVTIRNCVIKNSRRMAIALVDGRDILIEGNTFVNTGQPSEKTDGGEVGYAINIEPARTRDKDGNLLEYHKVFDVLITGNNEIGSRGGFLTLTIGQDITVKDNDIGTRLVYSLVNGVKVSNNRFKAIGTAIESWAIFCAGSGETVFNNEVDNNSIEGYNIGMVIGSVETYAHDNIIKGCSAGIQISGALNARIVNNVIDVTSNGIQCSNTQCDGVEIKGNKISTSGNFNAYFTNVNNTEGGEDQTILFEENTFSSIKKVVFSNTVGITFNKNIVSGGIELGNVSKMMVFGNEVKPEESDGIRIYGAHTELQVLNNIIYEPTGADRYVCLNNNSDTPAGVVLNDNSCN